MKCKELGKELDVTPMRVGRIRKQLFPDAESGTDLNAEEVAAIREAFSILESVEVRKEMEEAVKPTIIDAYISMARAGNREVECAIMQEDGSYKRVKALMPMNVDFSTQIRKPVKLEVIEFDGDNFYRHATLAGRAWGKIYG